MKNRYVPLLVFGSIFFCNSYEDAMYDHIDRTCNYPAILTDFDHIDDLLHEIEHQLEKDKDVIEFNETFQIKEMAYNILEPEFHKCIGTDYNKICAEDGHQYAIFSHVIRNDSDHTALLDREFLLEAVDEHGRARTLWPLTQAEAALYMSGYEVAPSTLEANMQKIVYSAYYVNEKDKSFRIKTPSKPALRIGKQ